MKYLVLVLALMSVNAHAVIKCKSMRDPNFIIVVEGYTCPAGYFVYLD